MKVWCEPVQYSFQRVLLEVAPDSAAYRLDSHPKQRPVP